MIPSPHPGTIRHLPPKAVPVLTAQTQTLPDPTAQAHLMTVQKVKCHCSLVTFHEVFVWTEWAVTQNKYTPSYQVQYYEWQNLQHYNIYRLQIFVIPAFQTAFYHQLADVQFLFTTTQIFSMSYYHENLSFITYSLFFQTKSDKIYSRIITIQYFHSYIAMHKNHVLHDRARISHFSGDYVRENTSRNNIFWIVM